MKIVVLSTIGNLTSVGIVNKTIKQVIYLNLHGIKTKGFIIHEGEKILDQGNIQYINIDNCFGGFRKYYKTVDLIISKNRDVDFFLLRYPRTDRYLLKLLKQHGKKIIFEYNTIEINEIILNIKNFTFKDHLYTILNNRSFYEQLLFEKFFRKKSLKLSCAGICVTNEIQSYNKKIYSKYTTLLLPNSIDIEQYPEPEIQEKEDSVNIMFLAGSKNIHHGTDRILRGTYFGDKKINVDIYGDIFIEKKFHNSHPLLNFNFYKKISHDVLISHSKKYHLAISSMGIHRIPLKEACPLKTREYLALGLPVIIGYNDSELGDSKFVFQVPQNDAPLDFDQVIKFYNSFSMNKHYKKDTQTYCRKYISMSPKMKVLSYFLKKLQF